jgi:hypothetical protein
VLRFRLMGETRLRLSGLKHQKEKRSMDHFAGLDVSVKETSVKRIGLEAGPLSQWLFSALAEADPLDQGGRGRMTPARDLTNWRTHEFHRLDHMFA